MRRSMLVPAAEPIGRALRTVRPAGTTPCASFYSEAYVFRAPGAAGSEIVDWSEGDGEKGGAGVEAAAAPDGGA